MVSQQHKIRRQVLEVAGCNAADAPRLQAALRGIFYRWLLPALDKACSDASVPGRVDRIERLEINLGPALIDTLEASWAAAFDRTFPLALARGLADSPDAGEPGQLRSHLDLFAYFLRTGTVPWWADRSDRALIETALSTLIERAPAALLQVIDTSPDRRAAWRRIVLAHSDRALDALARLLGTPGAASPSGRDVEWLGLVTNAAVAQGSSASAVRLVWWEERLGVPDTGDRSLDAPQAAGTVLPILAERLGLSFARLIADLRRPREQGGEAPSWAREVLDGLVAAGHGAAGAAEARAALAARLDNVHGANSVSASDGTRAEVLVARLPASERGPMLARLSAAQHATMRARPSEAERASMLDRQRSGRDGGFTHQADGDGSAPNTGAERPAASAPSAPPRAAAPAREWSRSSRLDGVDLRFSDADAIEVENAGLVILWPFLERFFGHLDLVRGKEFLSDAARQRAVGLLQYLATEDSAGPEFLVPLNKVLCGMAPEAVFDFGPPITPEEMTAAGDLLTAVIHNAPVLRDMSATGFRGSFLLRHGQLSARDGHFLLRVARETHDIVLDRFPWSSSLVKLPWMTALMQVEW
jgi:hypothetical protein